MKSEIYLLISQIVLIILFFVSIYLLYKYSRAIRFEKRIGRYSAIVINDNTKSFFDVIYLKFGKIVKKLRNILLKLKIFNNYAKKYSKYISFEDSKRIEPIDYITSKILISLLFVILIILSNAIQYKVLPIFEIIIYLILGFYLLDIYLILKQKRRLKLIEREMLKAVIIMNNSFMAGKSTLQAVKIASEKLPYPISDEFKKIYQELNYGISIEIAFSRFADRVKLEEARYLSSSLTILNKTGGNIVEVFSSIEKTLFDKKKLKEELKNLTASSNLMVKILLVSPILFALVIYILNPNYFDPLFNSPIGIIVLIIIFILFIMYAFILEKIMKVKV